MSIQTKSVFREKFAEWDCLSQAWSTLSRKRHSPTLAITIQDIFSEEDVNTELNAMRAEVEIEAVQFLPHRFPLSFSEVKND